MKRKIASVLLSIFAIAAPSHANGAPKTIRLGLGGNKYDKPYASGIWGIAQERQIFEKEFAKEGIKIEWNLFKGTGPATNEALANGKIDLGNMGDLPAIAGKAGGLPVRLLFPRDVGGGKSQVLVSRNSTIRTIADLKGKRITFSKGTTVQLQFNKFIHKLLNASERDFKVYSLTSGDQEVALAAGSVDAIFGGSTDLVDRGVARVLFQYDDTHYPEIQGIGTVFVTQAFSDRYPDIVQRFVNAYVKLAAEVLNEKNRETFVSATTRSGASRKNVLDGLPRDLEFTYAPVFDEYFLGRLQKAVDDAAAYGLIRRKVDIASWIEPKYLEHALREQGLDKRWQNLRSAPSTHK